MEYIMNKILEVINENKQVGQPFVVGLNGIDTSGKSSFAVTLGEHLISIGKKVQIVHIDDFLNPKSIRYSGTCEIDNYYNKSFDLNKLITKVLAPIKIEKKLSRELDILNVITDTYDIKKNYEVDGDTIVILEGVFIFKCEIELYLDYKIFIDMPFRLCKERATKRDVPLYGQDVLNKYDIKYIPAQQLYLNEYPPSKHADMIIDNTDYNNPYIRE